MAKALVADIIKALVYGACFALLYVAGVIALACAFLAPLAILMRMAG